MPLIFLSTERKNSLNRLQNQDELRPLPFIIKLEKEERIYFFLEILIKDPAFKYSNSEPGTKSVNSSFSTSRV